jgi:hypothetical protein
MIWLIDDQWFSMMGIIQPIEQGIEISVIFNMNMSLRGALVFAEAVSYYGKIASGHFMRVPPSQ